MDRKAKKLLITVNFWIEPEWPELKPIAEVQWFWLYLCSLYLVLIHTLSLWAVYGSITKYGMTHSNLLTQQEMC